MDKRHHLSVCLAVVCGVTWLSPAIADGWHLAEQKDEMRGATRHILTAISQGSHKTIFSLRRRSHVDLNLRSDGTTLEVYLAIGKGQINCSWDGEDIIAVKFDTGPVQEFRCHESSLARHTAVFFHDEMRFFQELRGASNLIIEVPIFNDGRRRLHFSVACMPWRYSGSDPARPYPRTDHKFPQHTSSHGGWPARPGSDGRF